MNTLQVFKNPQFGPLRGIAIEGESWLVGKDVAERLGYVNPRKALIDHVDDEDKGVTKWNTPGGVQDVTIINESGLYALIFSSKLPAARAFKRWVTHDVLPAIRRTGRYASSDASEMSVAEAVRTLRDCAPEIRPQILALLERAGYDLPALGEAPNLPPMARIDFARWFRQAYITRGMTYQEVADALHTSRMNVWRWGSGTNHPRAPYMRRIVEYFGAEEEAL